MAGPWTWSKEKDCFFATTEAVLGGAAVVGPAAEGTVDEEESTVTIVGPAA